MSKDNINIKTPSGRADETRPITAALIPLIKPNETEKIILVAKRP